jgi:hypothetical protein
MARAVHGQRLETHSHVSAAAGDLRVNELARLSCPIYRDFATGYHWSVNQCEYATDVVFRKQADLQTIYGNLTRAAIHTVKPDTGSG